MTTFEGARSFVVLTAGALILSGALFAVGCRKDPGASFDPPPDVVPEISAGSIGVVGCVRVPGGHVEGVEIVCACTGGGTGPLAGEPSVEWRGRTRLGASSLARSDGCFGLTVPLSPCEEYCLEVLPRSAFLQGARLFVDTVEYRSGELFNVGYLKLGRAGVAEGRVFGPSGDPIAGAEVSLPDDEALLLHSVMTDSEGRYRLANVRPGEHLVRVKAAGYLFFSMIDGVEIRAGRVSSLPDTILEKGPVLRGVVLRADSSPAEGFSVEAWPLTGGASAFARTDVSGEFVLHLFHDCLHELVVIRDARMTTFTSDKIATQSEGVVLQLKY